MYLTFDDDEFERLKYLPEHREDHCEIGKRVELHVHTKMSAMDGINEPSSIVRKAALWGQPAVAITDHGVVQAFPDAWNEARKLAVERGRNIKIIYGLEGYVFDDENCMDDGGNIDYKSKNTNHITILAKNQEGLKNLYKLVSISHLQYFYKQPRIPWSVLNAHREGLIVGSACEVGEVYDSFIKKTWKVRGAHYEKDAETQERREKIASRYDFLEIQPVLNNHFMFDRECYFEGKRIQTDEDLRNINKAIVELAIKLGKPVVATTDAHYTDPEDAISRSIIMEAQGYSGNDIGGSYMRTTEEMLEEFAYLGEERAIEVVITNTNMVAEQIDENIIPIPLGRFLPKIENADKILRETCMKKAHEIYGNPLPEKIGERLEKELIYISNNDYASIYVSAQMLVDKSLSEGYLVGSRGAVGASFAATMAGITDVNPLEPHYVCPNCKHVEWGNRNLYDCGIDMPPKDCPECGTTMKRDGFSLPLATFLGIDGDKEPDIDLNFARDYQATAQKYVGEIFGTENTYKAGTIGTVPPRTAARYVRQYVDEYQLLVNEYEEERLIQLCTGVKRTTGQHPGGVVVIPDGYEIYDFCPLQRPGNDVNSDVLITHFDYRKLSRMLFRFDILGHHVPQMLKQLQDMTGVNPQTIDLTDRTVLSIFDGIEALKIKDKNYRFVHGTYGIPEFSSPLVRHMIDVIHPKEFDNLIKISGFCHGTDVWFDNADYYLSYGIGTMREAISTRDDIMNYLMLKGVDERTAFDIMETVRKNRPFREEHYDVLREYNVPDWYIDACIKTQYAFPRAHVAAYVMMAFRMAWFKVYYPLEFYAVYFTLWKDNFDQKTILKGKQAILDRIDEIEAKENAVTDKEKNDCMVLEVAYEMYCRGFEFIPANREKSDKLEFIVEDGKVLLNHS